MSITVDNGDGTYTVLAGHPAGIDAYMRAMERTEDINQTSKFKMHQRVRIKDDYPAILEDLLEASCYRYLEAVKLSQYLAGKEVQVISPDRLWNIHREEKIYYSVSLDTGEFHVMPEHLLEEIV